jgi:hypothetical protein
LFWFTGAKHAYAALFDVLGTMQMRHEYTDAGARHAARDDVGWKVLAGLDTLGRDERGEPGCQQQGEPRSSGVRRTTKLHLRKNG